jgi:ArsR family transcriptional regulator, virulence genes transcriptional regulator
MKINISKTELVQLERQADTVAELLSAMANAKRLLILCQLAGGEKTVSQIVEAVAIAQSAASQHLAKMRLLQLVKTRRDGKQIYYSIASEAVASIMQSLYAVYCAPKAKAKGLLKGPATRRKS